ncbi:unnamed protein product, partial [Owenia fusiformis]
KKLAGKHRYKRSLDSISYHGDFGSRFAKRNFLPLYNMERRNPFEEGYYYHNNRPVFFKRFDSNSRGNGVSGYAKRHFDSINGPSGFAKKSFDSIDGMSGLVKKSFDSIDGISGFSKKSFDSISGNALAGFAKRYFDSIDGTGMSRLTKRSLDKRRPLDRIDRPNDWRMILSPQLKENSRGMCLKSKKYCSLLSQMLLTTGVATFRG